MFCQTNLNVCVSSELMETMGFSQNEVKKALDGQKYNEATAIYLLLGMKSSEVFDVFMLEFFSTVWSGVQNPARTLLEQ